MNFEHYLKSIELIAGKLYPDYTLEEAVSYIIEKHLLYLIEQNKKQKVEAPTEKQHIKLLMEILKDQEMVLHTKFYINILN